MEISSPKGGRCHLTFVCYQAFHFLHRSGARHLEAHLHLRPFSNIHYALVTRERERYRYLGMYIVSEGR